MPGTGTFAVQCFATDPDGRTVLGRRIVALSGEDAVTVAWSVVPTVPGAVALHLVLDRDQKVVASTILSSVGDVPDMERLAELLLPTASSRG